MSDAKVYHKLIQDQQDTRTSLIEKEVHIREAMISYLKEVGETEDFTLIWESFGAVKLTCHGDIFDLEQIGDFCEVFNLELCINNRLVVEDHLRDMTTIKTNYLFQIKHETEKEPGMV